MTEVELIRELDRLFSEIFRKGPAFGLGVARKDHVAWDSLAHMQLMLALEKRFAIELGMADVLKLQNGRMIFEFVLERCGNR
ncbi:MAG: hypothetical protein A2X94_08415 [Bdellovibrionales bacterium GWB1_55_8]|nr:MAG: hypothetical protein A2X94_08415 [Bdellovibrionales bacterium GWB1_55_8]